jgi:hypothetical protein
LTPKGSKGDVRRTAGKKKSLKGGGRKNEVALDQKPDPIFTLKERAMMEA